MNDTIIQYETEDGDIIYVSVDAPHSAGGYRGSAEDTIKEASMKFEKALSSITSVAKVLKKKVAESKPDEFSAEFSMKSTGETGFFTLCKASIGAELKITLTWKKGE